MTNARWFGTIPEGWRAVPLYGVASERKIANRGLRETNLLSLSYGRIVRKDIETNERLLPASFETYQIVRPDDIVLRMTDLQNDQWSLRSALVGETGIITSAYLALRLRNVEPRFMAYQFRAIDLMKVFYSMGGGLRQSIGFGDLKRLRVLTPPVEEQQAIADYLDRETAQIDAFIAKNEELIALLTERRAAVIAHAVTRGVDDSVPLKASGVEWLGDVPIHWSVQRLASTVARARNGVWGADAEGGEEDLRCVRVADFDRPRQRIHDDAHTLRKLTASERDGRILRNGDLLLEKCGGGEKSPVGFVVLYDRDEPAVCSNFVARVQLHEEMDPRFWTYVHGSMYRLRITEKSLKQSTGIQNLDQSAYFNEYVAVPPYREQCAIADHIERRAAKIDAATATASRSVELARERRAALISAAVTGKISVAAQ